MTVYNYAISSNYRRRVCESLGATEVAMGGRVAIVMFITDAIKGTGRGFTGTFSSIGMFQTTGVLETVL